MFKEVKLNLEVLAEGARRWSKKKPRRKKRWEREREWVSEWLKKSYIKLGNDKVKKMLKIRKKENEKKKKY